MLIPFAARKLMPAAEAAPMLPEVKLAIKLAGTVPPDALLTAAASVLLEIGAGKPNELIVPLITITFLTFNQASANGLWLEADS